MIERTEEILQVRLEVVEITLGADEGDCMPVRVGPGPKVPLVTADRDARRDLGTDGLDAAKSRRNVMKLVKS